MMLLIFVLVSVGGVLGWWFIGVELMLMLL